MPAESFYTKKAVAGGKNYSSSYCKACDNKNGYIINVAGYRNGIGYGPWVTIDGWSEAVIEYIRASEETDT